MVSDLPDYERKIVIVNEIGSYPAIIQVDLRQILGEDLLSPTIAGCVPVSLEHVADINHKQILGVELKTPTFAQSIPTSIENDAIAYDEVNDWFKIYIENEAIAYDAVNDRFKVDIDAVTLGTLDTTTDLIKVLGAALAHNNPVITRLTDGSDFIDPRDRNWIIDEDISTVTSLECVLGSTLAHDNPVITRLTDGLAFIDPRDISDRAARLLGIAYGNKGQLQQRATSLDLLVQLMSAGAEIDPRSIRALTSSDVVTAQQTTRTSMTVKPEREDLVSLGGVASPNAAGVQIVAADGTKKIKVFDCGYEALAAGLHYFYFGTSTVATTARLLTRNTTGAILKSFVQPRVSAAGDGLYLYSAVSETNMPYDVGYVQE